jgi:DNA modification methylase
MPRLESESVDLVFSSPPYFNVERYCPENTQSFQRYRTYPAWKANFLQPVLAASHRILRRGGHLVVNVADTAHHAIAQDVEQIARTLFRRHRVLRLLMHSRPLQRSTGVAPYRWEPVLIFEKVS